MATKFHEENVVFNSEVWGPNYWFFLMTLALSYPNNVNAVVKRKYYDFISNLPIFIPNSEIAHKFSNLLDKYPVSPYLDNRESFVKWVHFIHNKINDSLGKEEISYAQAIDNYLSLYRPKPICISERIVVKKYFVVAALIFFCFLFIYLYWEK
jgi:hypothetical protein